VWTFEIRFLSVIFVSCNIYSTYPTYLGVVSSFFSDHEFLLFIFKSRHEIVVTQ